MTMKKFKNYVSEAGQLLQSFQEAHDNDPVVMAERNKFTVTKDMPSAAGLKASQMRQDRLAALRKKARR